MAGRLAPVPEESADCSTAAYPPRSLYRDSIRQVAVSRRQIGATLFSHSQSGHSGSTDSGTSNSYPSNNSGCSSGSAQSTIAADFGTNELTTIACRMVSDGYAHRLVQAYHVASLTVGSGGHTPSSLEYGDSGVPVLENWFLELDLAWVLQIRQHHGSEGQLWLQDKSDSSLQDLVQRWIRGLTVIVNSIVELVSTRHEMGAVARFGEASISKMVVFVDAIVPVLKAEDLRTVLDMHICVCRESDNMQRCEQCFGLEFDVLPSLYMSVNKLKKAISSTMEKLRTLVEDEGPWPIEILRGGEIHRSTGLIADCIVSLREAEDNSILILDDSRLSGMRYHMIVYLKHLLLRKSELCSDPSLRYLFLLNNSYFAAQMIGPRDPRHDWKLPFFVEENDWKLSLQCKEYMDSYLDVSWGHVLSCIPKSHFPGPLHRWINTSSLVKFESAFNKTYKAQKFWMVPDPQLRDELRRAITERVVSGYRDYLKEHPELAEHVSRRNSTPEVLEEMLSQLFEG